MTSALVFFQPKPATLRLPSVVDVVCNVGNRQIGTYSGKTLIEMQAEYPGLIIISASEAAARIEAAATTKPVRCTVEEYDARLGVVPPIRHTRTAQGSSFILGEALVGRVHRHYVAVAGECWTFHDLVTMSHEQAIAHVRAPAAKASEIAVA